MPRALGPSRRACAWRCAVALLLAAAPLDPPRADDPPPTLTVQSVPLAENLKTGELAGKLRFRGMLFIPSVTIDGARLSQLSDIAWDNDAETLYAISDKGTLFHLRPVFSDGLLVDLKLARAVSLRDFKTEQPLRDRRGDAEGMDILHGDNGDPDDAELIVSFERFPRILRYRPNGHAIGEYVLPPALADKNAYINPNRMLESVCHDERFGVLTAPEKPLAKERRGYSRIYNLTGKSWLYPLDTQNRITALACLGDGEVLVLEGNFGTRFWRSHATLKRVRLPQTDEPDVTLQPETLSALESNKGYQIDNFEGIARHRGNRFFLVSDDNDFFLQRTLLLYFELE